MSLKGDLPISSEIIAEIAAQSQLRFRNFQLGMAQYLAAQVPEWQPSAKVVAQIGSSRLLEY